EILARLGLRRRRRLRGRFGVLSWGRGRRAGPRTLETRLRSHDVTLVRPVLDLARDAHPVRLVRVVLLEQHVEPEPQRGVPDLLLAQEVDLPVDVLTDDRGLEPPDAHEILV